MSFLLHRKTEKRDDRAVNSFVDFVSFNDSKITSNFIGESALLQSDIYTAVRIIAGDIASAKINVQNNEHIYDLLNKKANNSTTAYNFKFAMVANMLLNGDSYAHIERNDDGIVTGLRVLLPSQVVVRESEDGKVIDYKVTFNDGTKEIDCEDMLHFKAFSIDGKVGKSPLYSLTPELSMLKNGNSLLASFFKRGVNSSAILKLKEATIGNSSKREIKKQFEEINAGIQNSGGVIVLDETQEYMPIEVNTKVLEMIQNNKYSTQQIAKVFGIPLSRFGQELMNTSDSQQNDIYITSTLNAYSQAIEQELAKLNCCVEFDFSTLRSMDKNTMLAKAIQQNGGNGFLKVDEVRAFYGLDQIGGNEGETIFVNSASVPLVNEVIKNE